VLGVGAESGALPGFRGNCVLLLIHLGCDRFRILINHRVSPQYGTWRIRMFVLNKTTPILAATTLAVGLLMPTISFARGYQAGGKNLAEKKEGKEGHPVIKAAIRELQHVKMQLQTKAASDFKGHKAAAIKSIDEAIEHLNQALQSDTK